jgi:hypothetical protein
MGTVPRACGIRPAGRLRDAPCDVDNPDRRRDPDLGQEDSGPGTHPVFPAQPELPARWTHFVRFGRRILGALGAWIVGSWIMRFIAAEFDRMLAVRIVDLAPGRYLEASERRGSRT